jgi:hypothetical protein
MPTIFKARCFGLDWHSDIELEHFSASDGQSTNRVIAIKRVQQLEPRDPLHQVGRATIDADGFRFAWNDEVIFDFRGDTVRWVPQSKWNNAFPVSFYSSVAAMVAASVGLLPLHVSSILLNNKAWLIAGKAGAGKSTLVAELLSAGGGLLADDLTILSDDGGQLLATRGRPSIRLHPRSAGLVKAHTVEAVPDDPRGKFLVWPKARADDGAWPIAGIMLLGDSGDAEISSTEKVVAYGSVLFRPRIMAKLPGHISRRQMTLELARQVPAIRFPAVQHFGDADRQTRIDAVLSRIGLIP